MTVTLESLSDSRNTLARLCLLAVRAADKTWKGVDPRRVRDSWNRTNADFLTLFATLQTSAASDAMDSSTLMLAEQGDYVRPDGIANPLAFRDGFRTERHRPRIIFRYPGDAHFVGHQVRHG